MAVNPLFNHRGGDATELELDEDLIIEGIQFAGVDVQYVPRKWIDTDAVLGEVVVSKFDTSFEIEAVIDGLENMMKDAYVLNNLNFPLNLTTVTVTVSKKRFQEEVPDEQLEVPGRPNEGDLIFIPHISTLLEIKSADPDNLLSSGGRLFVYQLKCEFFRPNAEAMPMDPVTGFSDVDQVPDILLQDKMIRDDDTNVVETDLTGQGAAFNTSGPLIPETR